MDILKQKEMLVSLEIESMFSFLENYFQLTSNLLNGKCSNKAKCSNSVVDVVRYHFEYTRPLTVYYPYSFLILLYANVEACFKSLCNHFKDIRQLPFSIDKLSGDLGEKVMLFFQAFKIVGLEQNAINELTKFNKIRNVLVHENGIISGEKTKIKNILSQEKGIAINSHSKQIEIELSYCENKTIFFKLMFQNILSQNGFDPLFPKAA